MSRLAALNPRLKKSCGEWRNMKKIAYLTAGVVAGVLLASFAFANPLAVTLFQDATKLAPQMYKVVLDNNHVRVVDYHIEPGEKEPMHSHPCGVLVYYFTESNTRASSPGGAVTESHNRAGDVVWRDPVTHFTENIGKSEVHALLVEPKDGCQRPQ